MIIDAVMKPNSIEQQLESLNIYPDETSEIDKKVIGGLMEKIKQPVNKKIYRRCTVFTTVFAGDINIYDRIRCS